jgi:hypothetical protein
MSSAKALYSISRCDLLVARKKLVIRLLGSINVWYQKNNSKRTIMIATPVTGGPCLNPAAVAPINAEANEQTKHSWIIS